MRIGLYDSGLGGLSVLRELLIHHPEQHYIYLGDNARAPYGDKSPAQLISYVEEIALWMQQQQIELLISACNTSSMYLEQIDFSKFDFPIISLFDLMQNYFAQNPISEKIALMATAANINSARYLDWQVEIQAIKCPDLVPLIEAGNLEQATEKFQHYLRQLEPGIKQIIVGCTHYSFLKQYASNDYKFIDPAEILSQNLALENRSSSSLELFCTARAEGFAEIASRLLAKEMRVQLTTL